MFQIEAAEKYTFSKIIWQRKSLYWMHQIGSNLLRQFFLTICLTSIWLQTNLEVAERVHLTGERNIRNVVKDQPKNLYNEKYDAQVEVIGKAVMITGNIMLFSIFWTSEFELEGWKFTMTDRSLYLS